MHGVSVGEVRSVELAEDDVEVRFTLDSGIRLGKETTAEVKVATLLGNHYLEVDPRGGGSLAGATIPLERTSVPYNLQDVLEQGTAALDELDPDLLAQALTATSDALGSSAEEVGPALQGIAQLSDVISARSAQTGQLLRAARGVSDQLNAGSDGPVRADEVGQPRDRGGRAPARGDPPAARRDPRPGRRARRDRAADPRRPRPRAARPQHRPGRRCASRTSSSRACSSRWRRPCGTSPTPPATVPTSTCSSTARPSPPTTLAARWGTADEARPRSAVLVAVLAVVTGSCVPGVRRPGAHHRDGVLLRLGRPVHRQRRRDPRRTGRQGDGDRARRRPGQGHPRDRQPTTRSRPTPARSWWRARSRRTATSS